MKAIVATLMLLVTCGTSHAQVLVHSGESYTFNFTLSFNGPPAGRGPSAEVLFSGGLASQNFTPQIEIFADNVFQMPIETFSFTHTGPVPAFSEDGWSASFNPDVPPNWPDLQGVIRVTSLGGQFQVTRMYASQVLDGQYYDGWFNAVPVPEPSMISILVAGLICLPGLRRRGGIPA